MLSKALQHVLEVCLLYAGYGLALRDVFAQALGRLQHVLLDRCADLQTGQCLGQHADRLHHHGC